jgi:hypothetical protein
MSPSSSAANLIDVVFAAHQGEITMYEATSDQFASPSHPAVLAPSASASVAEVAGIGKARKKSTSAETDPDNQAHEEEVRAILDQITAAGNTVTRNVKKVAEVQTRSRQVVYLIKTQSRMNRVVLAVHPEHAPEDLARLPGVESVSSDHRFHSNMLRFPKKKNRGETETQYGWHVITGSLGDCQRFLASF